MAVEQLLERIDGVVAAVGQVARVRVEPEEDGTLLGSERVGEPQRAAVLRGGLAMRPDRCRPGSRLGRVAEHGRHVAGRLGMVRQAHDIQLARRRCRERGERQPVQREPPAWLERLVDRQARELVPEADGIRQGDEHARDEAFLERLDALARHSLEQPELDPLRRDRDRFEQVPGRRAEPGGAPEHRRADRVRDLVATGGQGLRDEERVAGRLPIQLTRVDLRGPASSATASGENGATDRCSTALLAAISPSTTRSGWVRSSSSSR